MGSDLVIEVLLQSGKGVGCVGTRDSDCGPETNFLWRFKTESVSEGSRGYSAGADGMPELSFSKVTLHSSHEEQIHLPAASVVSLPGRFTCICSRFPELIGSKNQVMRSVGSVVEM